MLVTCGTCAGLRGLGARVPRRRASAAMCAGVVPQQPPTMFNPSSSTKRISQSASSSGVSG
jgi:hypothetical protein